MCKVPFTRWIVCASLALVLLGCTDGMPKRVPISGRILIDGQPLQGGFIQVIPGDMRAATGQIGKNGEFSLTTLDDNDGCVLGTHQVSILASENQGPYAMKWHAPKKYADAATSGITLDVKEAKADVVINLTWDGGQPFVEKFENEGAVPGAPPLTTGNAEKPAP